MPRLAAILVLLCAGLAAGQNSLPLEGYYHPGRYMPVMVRGPLPATISSPDAVPTDLAASAGSSVSAVVPVLMLRAGTSPLLVRSAGGSETLTPRPLTDDQFLVGYTSSSQPGRTAALGPRRIVPVRVAVDQLSPALAWTTLDALVLDEIAFGVLPSNAVTDLLAGGVRILVEQTSRPAGDLPWRRSDPYWVCSPPLAGPHGAMLDHAYEPTLAWRPAWPAGLRIRVVIAAVVIAAGAFGLLLFRRWWAAPAGCALLLMAAAAAWVWHVRTPPVFQAAGVVRVETPGELDQRDLWLYQTAARRIDSALPLADFTVPMLYSFDQAQSQNLRLLCQGDGSPAAFAFRLEPNQRIGFLRRSVEVHAGRSDVTSAIPHPLISQLRGLYTRPGETITPLGPASVPGTDDFGMILISRPAAIAIPPRPASVPDTSAPSPAGQP